jgi:hypothetical protein
MPTFIESSTRPVADAAISIYSTIHTQIGARKRKDTQSLTLSTIGVELATAANCTPFLAP